MSDQHPNLITAADLVRFERRLPNFAEQLNGKGPVRIVALGSSSTAGRGDVLPYPCRLELALRNHYRQRFPDLMIDVVNRGRGGEEAPKEFKRMQTDVIAERPVLVIWQIGTNAVFRQAEHNRDEVLEALKKGLDMLRDPSRDVLLMDLQFAPAIVRPEKIAATRDMVARILDIAANAGVNVFHRFALMQYWYEIDGISHDRMTDPTDSDRLHQSDWSTTGVAQLLCNAIADAATAGARAA